MINRTMKPLSKYLVEFECGKNKIAGVDLFIEKRSVLVDAENAEDAMIVFEKGRLIGESFYSYAGYCYGQKWDYVKVTDLKIVT